MISQRNLTTSMARDQTLDKQGQTVILGAGLSGLTSGHLLSAAGLPVVVVERGAQVGGFSKTISHNGFFFDLGGHRFLTKDKQLERFVLELLKGDVLDVDRKSKIYMRNRYFDYPLKPVNAFFGLGLLTTLWILWDYIFQKCRNLFYRQAIISLEDWVVHHFGRKMFDLYFKDYSEKVWGIDCNQISMDWVAQRIRGLSLGKAVKNAFFKFSGKNLLTLSDRFFYPTRGIGEISERLKEGIEPENSVLTQTSIKTLFHKNKVIKTALLSDNKSIYNLSGQEFISSIPLIALVKMLEPAAPQEIINACDQLKFRDLVIVTIMLSREKVTDLTWMYLPEKDIPLGRIHEPKNWSTFMAPEGKTHIVAEYFCFKDDNLWNLSDDDFRDMTVEQLVKLDFIRAEEVLDFCVLRRPDAYPIFEVGYEKHYNLIIDYLAGFKNLQLVGRSGKFKYYNMDHAIASGMEAAQNIINQS